MAPDEDRLAFAFYCPRCSGPVEFDNGATPEAVSACGCGLRFGLGELRRITWADAFEGRVRAVDALQWWRKPKRPGQEAGWLLVTLAREQGAGAAKAVEGLRRALTGPAPPAEAVRHAAALLRELAPRLAPPVAAQAGCLLDDLGAA